MLLVGNHSGGNLTPDTGGLHARVQHLLRGRAALPPARPQPRALAARPVVPAQVRHRRRLARATRARRCRRAPRCSSTPAATTRSTARAGRAGGSTPTGARASSRLALEHDVPIVPVVSAGGQETALFLTQRGGAGPALGLDRAFRLKVLPISLALPWGLNVGDMLGHIPLPAKITVEALPPIHLRRRVRGRSRTSTRCTTTSCAIMQETLDALGSERRLPGAGMRIRAPTSRSPPRPRRSGSGSPTRRARSTSSPDPDALGGAQRPAGPGSARGTGCCCGSGSAEVGGTVEVIEFDEARDMAWTVGHRPRSARTVAPARAPPGGRTSGSSCACRTAWPAPVSSAGSPSAWAPRP